MAVVVPLTSGVIWLVGPEGEPDPYERVANCRAAHGAPVAPPVARPEPEPAVFGDCTWPPLPGAAAEGYYEIRVSVRPIPDSETVMEATHVEVIDADCLAVKV